MENVVPSENEVVGTLLALHRQVYCLQALVLGLLSSATESQRQAAAITLDTAVQHYKQPVKFGLEQTPAELLARFSVLPAITNGSLVSCVRSIRYSPPTAKARGPPCRLKNRLVIAEQPEQEAKSLAGSLVAFTKNGELQGVAFRHV